MESLLPSPTDLAEGADRSSMTRRRVLAAAAWSVPTVTLSTAAPAFAAASGVTVSVSVSDPVLQRSGTTQVAVQIVDGTGAPQAGRAVSLQISGAGVTASPASGVTDAEGRFSSTITVASDAERGVRTISVASPDGVATTTLEVAGSLLLTTQSTVVVPDMTLQVFARLVDGAGAPRAATTVYMDVPEGGPFSVGAPSADTDDAGRVDFMIHADQPGNFQDYTLRARTDAGDEATLIITLCPRVAVVVSPTTLEMGDSAQVEVTLRDQMAVLVRNARVRLDVSHGGSIDTGVSVSPQTVRTDSAGQVRATISTSATRPDGSKTASGGYAVYASVKAEDGVYITGSAGFEILPPVVPLAVAVDPFVVDWGQSTTVTVTATNPDRSPVVQSPVQASTANADVVLSASSGTTDANGKFTLTASVPSEPTTSGRRAVTATWGSETVTAEFQINAVLNQLTGFSFPNGIVLSGTTLYVADSSSLSVVSTTSASVLRKVDLPAACSRMVFDGSDLLYIVADNGSIMVYQISTNSVLRTIAGPEHGFGVTQMAIDPSRSRAYVTMRLDLPDKDFIVAVYDLKTNAFQTSIDIYGVYGVAVGVGKDSRNVYAVNAAGEFYVIRQSDLVVKKKANLESYDYGSMILSSDGKKAFIGASLEASNALMRVVDLTTFTVVGRTSLPAWTRDIALSPDGARVYLTANDSVVCISTSDYSIVNTYPAGPTPTAVVVGSSKVAYVTSGDPNRTMAVSTIDVR